MCACASSGPSIGHNANGVLIYSSLYFLELLWSTPSKTHALPLWSSTPEDSRLLIRSCAAVSAFVQALTALHKAEARL